MRDRLKAPLLAFSLLFLFMILPVNATFTWENNITVGYDEVQWMYTETYDEANSIIYKDYVDMSVGNRDGFINAWEVLKTDVNTRSALQNLIIEQMDVIVNGSSEYIVLTDVNSRMSPELLGPVMQAEVIKNIYTTNYRVVDPFLEAGNSNIGFIGEKNTPIVINMPKGISVNSTEGIDNVSVSNNGQVVKIAGIFGSTGKATVYFHLEGAEDIVASVPEVTEAGLSGEGRILGDEPYHDFSLAGRIFPSLRICNPESV